MRQVSIYTISDPLDNGIFYVGKSVRINGRISEYMNLKKNGTKAENKVLSIITRGDKPIFDIIDLVDEKDWIDAEMSYIRLYKSVGANLLNETPGGESGSLNHRHSDEAKMKISKTHSGIPKSESHKKKLSLIHKGRNLFPIRSEDHRSKMAKSCQGVKRGKTSNYRGVMKIKGKKPFKATITFNKKEYFKFFEEEISAALWYNDMAISFYGESARINSLIPNS